MDEFLYEWVPLYSNMLNSKLRFVRTVLKITPISHVFICLLNLKFAGLYFFFGFSGRNLKFLFAPQLANVKSVVNFFQSFQTDVFCEQSGRQRKTGFWESLNARWLEPIKSTFGRFGGFDLNEWKISTGESGHVFSRTNIN